MTDEYAWIPYDPQWLIELAKVQYPEEDWLLTSLANCTRCLKEDENLFYFIDRMEGHFKQNVVLTAGEKGRVVLDILTDGRIGGMEIVPGSEFQIDSI